METSMFVGGISLLLAFAGAYSAALVFGADLRGRRSALAAQGEKVTIAGLVAWRIRNGYAFADHIVEPLLRIRRMRLLVDEMVLSCASRGVSATRESITSTLVVWLAVLAIAVGALFQSLVAAFAVPVCAFAALSVAIGSARDKRAEAARDAVPAALESMAACFGSGFTLLQTFKQIAQEVPEPLSSTFLRSVHVLEMGGGAERALIELRKGAYASELSFVAVALDVQHRSGGAMRQVLDAATETVKDELALKRSLTVQTAQAKLSARVVSVMPFILIAAFSLASPDFLMPFFSSPQGYALLLSALAMQAAGIVLVRRALAVEGVA